MLHYRHKQKHFTIQMTLRMKVVHESRANECSNSWVCLRTLELLLTKQRQRLQSAGLPARQRKVKPALGIIMRSSHLICQHKRSSSPRCVPEYLAAKIRLEIKEKAELVFFFLIRACITDLSLRNRANIQTTKLALSALMSRPWARGYFCLSSEN